MKHQKPTLKYQIIKAIAYHQMKKMTKDQAIQWIINNRKVCELKGNGFLWFRFWKAYHMVQKFNLVNENF